MRWRATRHNLDDDSPLHSVYSTFPGVASATLLTLRRLTTFERFRVKGLPAVRSANGRHTRRSPLQGGTYPHGLVVGPAGRDEGSADSLVGQSPAHAQYQATAYREVNWASYTSMTEVMAQPCP